MATDTASAAPSEREQFEAWAKSHGTLLTKDKRGNYQYTPTSAMWKAWQAARRAQPTPPAVVEPMTDEQITEIWAAKVRYHAAPIGSTDLEFARDIERAHGIKKGDSHG